MNPKDAFGLVIRTLGLTISLFGVYGLAGALFLALFPAAPHLTPPGWALFYGGLFLVVGLYLVRGAPGLLRFAYPDTQAEPAANAKQRISWDADA